MLSRLVIKDVVLVKKLAIEFNDGFCVLTGETGAGKSILLDSLALALGKRSESRLIRNNANEAEVIAEFDLDKNNSLYKECVQNEDITDGETLILRRKINRAGRSKAWLNDRPVSVSKLKEIGERVLEIYGQFGAQKLLNSSMHMQYLDDYGNLEEYVQKTSAKYYAWKEANNNYIKAVEAVDNIEIEKEFLNQSCLELRDISPIENEEEELVERRAIAQFAYDIANSLQEIEHNIAETDGIKDRLLRISKISDKLNNKYGDKFSTIAEAIEQFYFQLDTFEDVLANAKYEITSDPSELDNIDKRLFILRSCARKHRISVSELPTTWQLLEEKLAKIENKGNYLEDIKKDEQNKKADYLTAAQELYVKRTETAKSFAKKVNDELNFLMLKHVNFSVNIDKLTESMWHSKGINNTEFFVSTIAGAEPGTIAKIASGGELSRIVLAMRIVLAKSDGIASLILDEADAGVSGRVADAIGNRLANLAKELQLIVITHSAQVAATANSHFLVEKLTKDNEEFTNVRLLQHDESIEAIARMLSGQEISNESIAAAKKLKKLSNLDLY